LPNCRLVARNGNVVLGWAALSPVSKRQAYAGVAEVSVYVAATARGAGVGGALMRALIEARFPRGGQARKNRASSRPLARYGCAGTAQFNNRIGQMGR
jgi:L-amino acid N-acyltransferase YncA